MNQILNHSLNAFLAMAPQPQPGQEQPSLLVSLIPMVLMITVFYFILIRPQMKAKKEQDQMVAALKNGDEVVTSGGIMGTITHVKEKSVSLKVADSVKIEVLKSHISTKQNS